MTTDPSQRVLVISPPSRRWLPLDVTEFAQYRHVLRALVVRALRARYKQAALGVLWILLQPLIGVVLFTLVFNRLAGLPSNGIPYPVFVCAGIVAWSYFSAGIGRAATSVVEERTLVTKVYFPRLLAPVAGATLPLVDFAVTLIVLAVVMLAKSVTPGLAVVTLPLWIAALFLLASTIGAGLAALYVRYRDIREVLTYLTQFWFFASPVAYPSSEVHGWARTALSLNPVTGVLDGFRWSAIGGPPPPTVDLISAGTGLGLALVCLVYFRHAEQRFADLV